MNNDRSWLAPLAGVAFFVLALVAFTIAGEPPDPADDPVGKIVDFYVDDSGRVILGSVLQTIAASLLVLFAAALCSVLRDAPGATGTAALATFAGLVIVAIGIAIDATINFALAETAEDIDPAAVQALSALWSNDFLPMAMGMQVFLLGLALSVLRRRALPAWVGWVALVLAVIAVTPIGFVSFIAGGVLIAVISVLLTMRARSAASGTAAPDRPATS